MYTCAIKVTTQLVQDWNTNQNIFSNKDRSVYYSTTACKYQANLLLSNDWNQTHPHSLHLVEWIEVSAHLVGASGLATQPVLDVKTYVGTSCFDEQAYCNK